MSPRSAVWLIPLLIFASGCADAPTSPGPAVLRVGTVTAGRIASVTDTARYQLDLTDGRGASIYLTVQGSPLRLQVRNAAGQLVAFTDGQQTGADPLRPTSNVASSPQRYSVTVSFDSTSGAWTGPSDFHIRLVAQSRAPEHVPALLPFDAIVRGEDVAQAMDIDSFTVVSPQEREINVYARQTTHSSQLLGVSLVRPAYFSKVFYVSGTDTVFGAQATGRVVLEAGIQHTLYVYAWGFDTTSAPYEVELRTIDHQPEGASPDIVPDDTVRGAIDYVGDVDDYTLTASPGARFKLFAQAQGSAPHVARVAIGSEYGVQAAYAAAGAPPTAESSTGAFTIPADGHLTISVTDAYDRAIGFVGPYSFVVVPLDSVPAATRFR